MTNRYSFEKTITSEVGKTETGVIKLFDHEHNKVGEYNYRSGPWGKGHIPYKDHYDLTTGQLETFHPNGKKSVTMDCIRLSDNNFKADHRDGVLIHKDRGHGTKGCIGIAAADWDRFHSDYKKIPVDLKPHGIDSSQKDIAEHQHEQAARLAKAIDKAGPKAFAVIKKSFRITGDDIATLPAGGVSKVNHIS